MPVDHVLQIDKTCRMIAVSQDDILTVPPLSHTENGIYIGLWQHNLEAEPLKAWVQSHLPHIGYDDLKQLRPKRMVERLSVRILLACMYPDAPALVHLPSGAPTLPGTGYHISISHTQGAYGVSLSTRRQGIDLEVWGDKALRVRSMFIRDDEQPLFEALSPSHTPEQIATLIWSAKESVYKLFDIAGLGLREDIRLTYVSPDTLQATLPYHHATARLHYRSFPDFVFTCAQPEEDLGD